MLNAKKIEEIARQVTDSIPPGLKTIANDFEDKTKTVLQRKLSQLDVVTREEFDVQTQVLIKTRAQLNMLENKIAELEASLQEKKTAHPLENSPENNQAGEA
ncbi:ubiquinone biosynthesis accessory factor UbiK [Thalassomonas haliotis]|uniref:Ubiquinone biosynthesis accessory factor UbiK n=1 Tax=Thalassomonas haliotis TaxID=485448 RepID=A0ABY7VDK3_9GAMM|nr:accessory factor UbiK family protein [Thalassomonas haliotis]WDE11714.1 accessory factor UbiK family protein [Thalassomonas haliotis]